LTLFASSNFEATLFYFAVFSAKCPQNGTSYFLRVVTTRAWSLIRNEEPIVLFEKHCHATEKSEDIACARRYKSSRLTGWWTQKESSEKMGAQGGGEAQCVAEPQKEL
jgi:hypothetical protein